MNLPIQSVGVATGSESCRDARALFRLSAASGDERLAIDPHTGRNRYGVPPECAPGEVWFASSTASPVSGRAHATTVDVLDRVLAGRLALPSWSESIRARLQAMFGIPGSQVILTGSGTEAELLVVALAHAVLGRPLLNVVVAPQETGSGVTLAAEGRHFLDSAAFASDIRRGEPLAGMVAGRTKVACVDIRAADGSALAPQRIDAAALSHAEQAIADGRGVVLHCLDSSKTGLSGFSRAAARAFSAAHEDRCLVVVDACQLRCAPAQIRRDLAAGFIVAITGSKFAGGPPFCGALLLPPDLATRLDRLDLVAGLAPYTAAQDWPAALRERVTGNPFGSVSNLALYTRWEAALTELHAFASIDRKRRHAIVAAFGRRVQAIIRATPRLHLIDASVWDQTAGRTIFPVLSEIAAGVPTSVPALYQGLRERGFHVGQPVRVGPSEALRICISMPLVTDIAERMRTAGSLETAIAPVEADLRRLVAAWSALRDAPVRRCV